MTPAAEGSGGVAVLAERSTPLRIVSEALADREAWVVGGSVRDLLLGLPVADVDVVVSGDPQQVARSLAAAVGGPMFPLSERFGAWRVISSERDWQADISAARGGSIEADLAQRDFTVNAIAAPLQTWEPLVDPHGGRGDLDARVLRLVSERAYAEDPLRTLRMARLACQLSLSVEERTRALAAAHAGAIDDVAPERCFHELRLLVSSDDPLRGIELMDGAGLVARLLPELEALKGVEQNPYHHLDVWGHTLAVLEALIEIERNPAPVLGEHAAAVSAALRQPLADQMSGWDALRLGALLHDAGKPGTRRVVDDRVLFIGHDELGAEIAAGSCRRLRTSTALGEFLAALARNHLRLGFLVHERPLTRRQIYRYLSACEPVELEVTVLTVADRLATRGERSRDEAVHAHLELARDLLGEALAWRRQPPRAPIGGAELMRALGLEPGPRVGELLELLREAAFTGEITNREQAVELARATA